MRQKMDGCKFALHLILKDIFLCLEWAEAAGWRRRDKNDHRWFILDVLLSGSCCQNTSLHPIPSHYLPAITAVQWVSCRVINTSTRPHTASTSSSARHLMTTRERKGERMRPLSRDFHASVFIHFFQRVENVYLHHERPAAETHPPDFAFKTAH